MAQLNTALLAFAIVLFVGGVTAQFQSCSDNSKVTKVLCNGQATGCILKRGGTATLEVEFTPAVSATKLKSVCHGIIAGIPAPFNDIDSNGCDGLTPSCPVTAKQTYSFKASIPVKSIYPQLKLIVKWEEQDENGNDVFCILVPAQIE